MPKFRVRTLMTVVAVVGILCAIWSAIEARRERGKWATVRIINHKSISLNKVSVITPDVQREIPCVPAGKEAEIPIRVEYEAKVRIEVGGRPYVEWGGVRGGSQPILTLSD